MFVASDGINTAVILRDPEPLNPRTDWDNLGTMVCWHNRRTLGDEHKFSDPHEFAIDLADKYINLNDLLYAIKEGQIKDLRLVDMGESFNLQVNTSWSRNAEQHWEDTGWSFTKDMQLIPGDEPLDMKEDLFPECSTAEIISLCDKSNNVAILPLFLYDHSGISMSTGSFVGRAPHAEWDSGQVGFIYMDKKTAMENVAMAADTLNVCHIIPSEQQKSVTVARNATETVDDALARAGYTPVAFEHVKNLYDDVLCRNKPVINEDALKKGLIFKKGNTLYEFDGYNENGSFNMESVARFNPDLKSLTEETWKSRAEEVLHGEVEDYDNYLTGEVYGYQLYEGTVEVDSCWGYFPDHEGMEPMYHEVLAGWHPELASKFEMKYDDTFDIDRFLEENDFPELVKAIQERVGSVLQEAAKTGSWPFATPYEDIIHNVDYILDDIVDALYQEHKMPGPAEVLKETSEHAGISRDAKPKISTADLDPNKDYTAEELMGLFKGKKNPLNDMIKSAAERSAAQASQGMAKQTTREEPTL